MNDFRMTIICADSGLWGNDVEGLTSNVRDEDVITHHISESPGVSLGHRSSKEGSMVIQ